MNAGSLPPFLMGTRGFIRGQLEQSKDGQVVLRTKQGVFPVKVEGEGVPLGAEIVFRFLREEPGLVVLSPYRPETLWETLPFFKELFAGEETLGEELLRAAVQENLPLTRDVFINLKKGLIAAEKEWGVKIHPRAVAFLQARAIPLTPRTLLWALYLLFPSAQKVMWQQADEQPPILPFFAKRKAADAEEAKTGEKNSAPLTETEDELLAGIFREARIFMQRQANRDPGLPHLLFYYCPAPQREIRWAGRGFAPFEQKDGDAEKKECEPNPTHYAFCLAYQSPVFGNLEILGVNSQSGLNLKVLASRAVLAQNLFAGLQAYLEAKGWPVQSVAFEEYRAEESTVLQPLRIDGWL